MRDAGLRGWAPWLLIAVAAAVLWAATMGRNLGSGFSPSSELDRLLLLHSLIPRAATALLAGGLIWHMHNPPALLDSSAVPHA